LLLAATLALLLTLAWSGLLDRAAQQRTFERLGFEDGLLSDQAATLFGRPEELDSFVRGSARKLNLRVTAIGADGKVLSDSGVPPQDVPRMDNHALRPEIVEAREKGSGSSRRFSAAPDLDFIYIAQRVSRDGQVLGYLRVASPVESVRAEESSPVWLGRAAVFGSCLLLFLAGAYVSRRLAAPLKRVTEAALAVAQGDLTRDPPEEDEPEAAALSEAVRRMKASLLASLAAAESEQRLTALVFDRLPSGVVVLGVRGEILQANASFARMLSCPDPTGRALVDLVREAEINALFRSAIESGTEGRVVWKRPEEVTWEVDALALPAGARGKTVGIFRDVSTVAKTEAMRRRFVSDVSHELRTPIASIAAAAETLVEGNQAGEETVRLTELIARQAERMRELIEDLTDLSRIESGAIELHREEVALTPLAREVCRDLAVRSQARNVRLEVEGTDDLTVWGDRGRVSQILHNLLDNAIKFSPEGEVVRVSVAKARRGVSLSVSDRGPGIPRSEREKIFQRFYQTDPSRSKVKPGTGLGLAIVKHLAALHDAAIDVDGEPGSGATFRVTFPA
jgi:two-component system phosphate regulon sensor histidine kinase PhoR